MGEAAALAGPAAIGALGLSAASSVIAGQGRADQYRTQAENYRLSGAAQSENYLLEGRSKSENYLQEGRSKSENYLLEGGSKSENYLLEGGAKATNYLYEGAAKKAEYGMTSAQDTFQGERAKRAAEFGKAQATATDLTMRDQLDQMLGNIDVIRAAGHADPTSPTSAAIKGYETDKSDRQRTAALVSLRSQVAEDEASADFFKQAAGFALTQGTAAEEMAKYNAGIATTYAERNAATARDYATRNAATALDYATRNAATALDYARRNAATARQYGAMNASSAASAADTAETTGWLNAAATILGAGARSGAG